MTKSWKEHEIGLTNTELLALRREDPKAPNTPQWLITNGINMGRWTWLFGVNCLADLGDNKNFVKFTAEENPDSIIEKYTLYLVKNKE